MADERTILVVEDDPTLGEMLSAYFGEQGYLAEVLTSGEDALRWLKANTPDVILLDIHLPGIDGFELCRRLRKDSPNQYTPVIFLTERHTQSDRLAGLELGAVDYMTKPFDVQELDLRVRNTVVRAGMRYLTNPVTGLPESSATREQLSSMFEQEEWGLVLAGIAGLREFSDLYGFVAADDVARASGMMIQQAVEAAGGCEFLGHLDAADFLIVTSAGKAGRLAEQCRQRLSSTIPYFYPAADWQALQSSPEMGRLSLHVATLTSANRQITTVEELRQALQSTL